MKVLNSKTDYKKYGDSKITNINNNDLNDPKPLSKQNMEELKVRINELTTRNLDIALNTIRNWLKEQ